MQHDYLCINKCMNLLKYISFKYKFYSDVITLHFINCICISIF